MVTACNEAGLSAEFLPHINIEYQMSLDLLISWRDITLCFLTGIKCRENVLLLLAHCVPPQYIPIIMVELNCFLHILWDLYPKLVSLQPILGFHFFNYTGPLLQIMRHPLIKGGLNRNLICHGVLRWLYKVSLFDIL